MKIEGLRRVSVGLCPGCGRSVAADRGALPDNRLALFVEGREVDSVALCRSCAWQAGYGELRTAAKVLIP